ncbi:MAG: hypothetical protein AAGE13_12980 [Pseudomonadota bacterium]
MEAKARPEQRSATDLNRATGHFANGFSNLFISDQEAQHSTSG